MRFRGKPVSSNHFPASGLPGPSLFCRMPLGVILGRRCALSQTMAWPAAAAHRKSMAMAPFMGGGGAAPQDTASGGNPSDGRATGGKASGGKLSAGREPEADMDFKKHRPSGHGPVWVRRLLCFKRHLARKATSGVFPVDPATADSLADNASPKRVVGAPPSHQNSRWRCQKRRHGGCAPGCVKHHTQDSHPRRLRKRTSTSCPARRRTSILETNSPWPCATPASPTRPAQRKTCRSQTFAAMRRPTERDPPLSAAHMPLWCLDIRSASERGFGRGSRCLRRMASPGSIVLVGFSTASWRSGHE